MAKALLRHPKQSTKNCSATDTFSDWQVSLVGKYS